jgi:hypothetical protein
MKNQIKSGWLKFLGLVITLLISVSFHSFIYASADNHSSRSIDDFKIGDKVEVSTGGLEGDQYYEPCVILEVLNTGYRVKCVYGNTEYVVQKRWVRPAKKAETVKEPESVKETEPVKEIEQTKETKENNQTNEQLFKQFDGNESGWLSGRELKACQCIQFDKNGDNEVTRAEFLAGMDKKEIAAADDDNVKEINKPAPDGDCTSNAMPVTKNTTANPSAELFKGLIFYNYNLSANGTGQGPLKVGVTFLSFQMGTSFTNIARNGNRINDAAPVNSTIYRVQSKHIVCEQYRDSTQRRQVESNYACFKNKNGIWVCGMDGFPKITQLN